ncbi:hypothetical protein EPH_0051000 [Eimeria praecox]|uniref:Uncharacterized protein n=1 Tax=Eimeria praecox TaxID=51316 RepID=U6GKW1_9EIME|nr:hypothetical protein EPH_0051000 [Eimeria praecox]
MRSDSGIGNSWRTLGVERRTAGRSATRGRNWREGETCGATTRKRDATSVEGRDTWEGIARSAMERRDTVGKRVPDAGVVITTQVVTDHDDDSPADGGANLHESPEGAPNCLWNGNVALEQVAIGAHDGPYRAHTSPKPIGQ